jgi:hypothetical protein
VIDFTRAFESAWERMVIILFRPFDFGKWCVIGFSAFLAGLIAGGNGVTASFNTSDFKPDRFQTRANFSTSGDANAALQQLQSQFSHFFTGMTVALIVGLVIALFLFILALGLLLFWLGARGQFMLLDNIVRNRGAIAWPWSAYARPANSFFLVYLLLEAIFLVVLLPIAIVAFVLCLPLIRQHRFPSGPEIGAFVALGVAYLVIGIAGAIVLFLYREFGIPIMFRQGILAGPAFWESLKLLRQFPGSICVFLLLRIAIFFALVVICAVLCCLTCCCLYQIPYVGTVLLLPALIYIRCFTLDCLAQFGPQYDAWNVDSLPVQPSPGLPPNPLPPLG